MYKGKFLSMLELKSIKPPNLVISVSSFTLGFIIQVIQYFQDIFIKVAALVLQPHS